MSSYQKNLLFLKAVIFSFVRLTNSKSFCKDFLCSVPLPNNNGMSSYNNSSSNFSKYCTACSRMVLKNQNFEIVL